MEPLAHTARETKTTWTGESPADDAIAANQAVPGGPLPRRSFLQLGVGGLAVGGALYRGDIGNGGDQSHGGRPAEPNWQSDASLMSSRPVTPPRSGTCSLTVE